MRAILINSVLALAIIWTAWYLIMNSLGVSYNPKNKEDCLKYCSTEVWSKDKCYAICGDMK